MSEFRGLAITRKYGTSILITHSGQTLEIKVERFKSNQARLICAGPADFKIIRKEALEEKKEEK